MIKKVILAASAIVIGLGTITPAIAGGPHGNRHFKSGHHGGHFSLRHRGHRGHGAGYALLGFGLGYLLYSASRPRSTYYRDPYYRGSGYYYPPPQYRGPITYGAPPPSSAPQSSQSVQEFPAGTNCLQTREYTTVLTIAGEEQEAYGTACLQADGTWIAGAPKIIPSFD
jgi:hypothetical protein